MKEHWLERFLVNRTRLDHCYSLSGTVDESGLDLMRNLVEELAKSFQSSRKCIFVSPAGMTLGNQSPIVLRPVVVVIGSQAERLLG